VSPIMMSKKTIGRVTPAGGSSAGLDIVSGEMVWWDGEGQVQKVGDEVDRAST